MVLSSPKGVLIFGRLSQGWSLKRVAPGEGPPLAALRVWFGMGGLRPELGMGPQAGYPKPKGLF